MSDLFNKRNERHQELQQRPLGHPPETGTGTMLDRRTFLAVGAGASVLLSSPTLAQAQSPAKAPTEPGIMPSNVRVERIDGSILLIGIRQDSDRVEL